MFLVIARSEAAKQSRASYAALDCLASPAMTEAVVISGVLEDIAL
jgi:hypothetical protein